MFKQGQRYRVWYLLDGQQRPRMFVGTYLGETYTRDGYEFDLRPAAGTSQLPFDALLAYRAAPTDAPHAQPRIVHDIPSAEEGIGGLPLSRETVS